MVLLENLVVMVDVLCVLVVDLVCCVMLGVNGWCYVEVELS